MSKLITYIVLRAIAIAGERIEAGSLVDLGPVLGAELAAAAKVRLATEDEIAAGQAEAQAADQERAKPAEPAPVVLRRGAAAKRAERAEPEPAPAAVADPVVESAPAAE